MTFGSPLGTAIGVNGARASPLEQVNPFRSSKAETFALVVRLELGIWVFVGVRKVGNWTNWSERLLNSCFWTWVSRVGGKPKLRSCPWWWWWCWILGFELRTDWACDETRWWGSFEDEEKAEEGLLFFLEPPPTGMFLREPPSVQYLLQVLQKYLGWLRL